MLFLLKKNTLQDYVQYEIQTHQLKWMIVFQKGIHFLHMAYTLSWAQVIYRVDLLDQQPLPCSVSSGSGSSGIVVSFSPPTESYLTLYAV